MIILMMISQLLAFELTSEASKNYEERAKNYLAPFKKELMSTLQTTMKEKGAVAAVQVCNEKAPSILQSKLNQLKKDGVEFGRTTHKLRNSDNAPRPWVQSYLEKFISGELKSAFVVKISEKRIGYLEPIMIQPACLNCHGEKIAPEVESILSQKYPNDQARGFKVGDFRGLFWLEMNP
ncbi:MAG: hypothetical protein Fur0010_12760 [Bdellovibrio sp.]